MEYEERGRMRTGRFYDDQGHCPKCGKWVKNIVATLSELEGIKKVEGECKTHGKVDISHQAWSREDFEGGE